MKWNKILTMFFLGASLLSSCSQEALVEPNEEVLTADVSVAFAVQDVKTKAYTNATEAEIALADVYVALYDSENNFIKGQSVKSPTSYGEMTVSKSESSYTIPAYKVTFKDIRTGKNGKLVYAVVVANAEITSEVELSNPFFSELSDVGVPLVKAGKSDPILLTAEEGTPNLVIEVPMIQLAAGIRFMGIKDDEGEVVACSYSLIYTGINLSTDLNIFDNTKIQNTQFVKYGDDGHLVDSDIFYTYESTDKSFSPMLTVTVTYEGESNKDYKYEMSISEILKAQNLELIKGHLYSITGRLSSRDLEMKWEVAEAKTIDVNVPDFE